VQDNIDKENKNEFIQDDLDYIFNCVLKFVKTMVLSAVMVSLIGVVSFWFMYDVKGKPLSTHTAEVGTLLVEELVRDGYLVGAKVLFTEDEYCHKAVGTKKPISCINDKDQKKLDNLIDSLIHFDVPPMK